MKKMTPVEAYVAKLLRKALAPFLGKKNDLWLKLDVEAKIRETLHYCEASAILYKGHGIHVRSKDDQIYIGITPPNGIPYRSSDCCKFTMALGGEMVWGSLPHEDNSEPKQVQEPRGGPMTTEELLARIASETGIPVNRLLIERCNRKFTLSVDVLNGTEDERWAAAAVLHKYRPAATEAHVSAPRDYTNCSLCGTRLKVVELTRKGKVQAKSRCPNALCKNSRHWMPSYRPEAVITMPPRVAMTFEATEVAMAAVAGFKDVEEMRKKIALGMQVPEKYLQGNYSSSLWAEEYYKKSTDLEHLSKTLKKLAKENGINITTSKAVAREGDLVLAPPVQNRFATTGRVSSAHPNEAIPPQEEYDELTISGLDQNDRPISEVVRVPKGGGTVVTKNSYKTYSLTPPTEGAYVGGSLHIGVDKGKDDTDYRSWWPEHIDTSWVGRRIVHRESGEVCTLGHLSSYGWYVHVPLQGTWRFSEQDLFRLFIPAPPEKDELSNIAYSTVKPRDVHQETADQLGITREEAKVRNFASLYGSKEPFTKYPLQGFSKLGKKDPKQG